MKKILFTLALISVTAPKVNAKLVLHDLNTKESVVAVVCTAQTLVSVAKETKTTVLNLQLISGMQVCTDKGIKAITIPVDSYIVAEGILKDMLSTETTVKIMTKDNTSPFLVKEYVRPQSP